MLGGCLPLKDIHQRLIEAVSKACVGKNVMHDCLNIEMVFNEKRDWLIALGS